MIGQELPYKPLVEAIFEMRVRLVDSGTPGFGRDPHYAFLLGRFFERVQDAFPFHETLPTTTIPEEMAGHTVQHRFRARENAWPLLQIGPGILTVNDTTSYKWESFHTHCTTAIDRYVKAHPASAQMQVDGLLLRYINAVDCDPSSENITEFLADKMRVRMELPATLFASGATDKKPTALTTQFSHRSEKPRSLVALKFATGHRAGAPALIWETVVTSRGEEVPGNPSDFGSWLNEAHDLAEDWFLKLIDGELLRRFSGA